MLNAKPSKHIISVISVPGPKPHQPDAAALIRGFGFGSIRQQNVDLQSTSQRLQDI